DKPLDPNNSSKGKFNPGELFLEVVGPRISLNATNNGTATGGLARTNSTLAALSRKTGLIGEIARNVVESQRLSTPHRLRDRGSFRNRFLRNAVGHRGQQQRNLAMTDHLAELPLGD